MPGKDGAQQGKGYGIIGAVAYQMVSLGLKLSRMPLAGPLIDRLAARKRLKVVTIPVGAAINMARTSFLTILVFQLTVKDIRIARELLSNLTAAGIPTERLMLLANRCRSRYGLISLQEAKQALGVIAVTCVDNDYKGAVRGADYGKPLAEIMPRSPIRKSMRKLAEHIVNSHPGTSRPTRTDRT
jgi:MinD-like ATPase involved in chromosome partitioning or flagellar assembly